MAKRTSTRLSTTASPKSESSWCCYSFSPSPLPIAFCTGSQRATPTALLIVFRRFDSYVTWYVAQHQVDWRESVWKHCIRAKHRSDTAVGSDRHAPAESVIVASMFWLFFIQEFVIEMI